MAWKVMRGPLRDWGIQRVALIAGAVLLVAFATVLLIELGYNREAISGAARSYVYIGLAAALALVLARLFLAFMRWDDRRRNSIAHIVGGASLAAVLLGTPLLLESGGVLGVETWQALSRSTRDVVAPLAALVTLATSVWGSARLAFETSERNRVIDAHNREVEERLEQITEGMAEMSYLLGEVVELLRNGNSGEK